MDIDAYLRRIGLTERPAPTLDGLSGLGLAHLCSVPFENLGFNTQLQTTPLPQLTWNALSKIPGIVSVGGVMLFGIWWITNRRQEVKEHEEKMNQANTTGNGKFPSSHVQ